MKDHRHFFVGIGKPAQFSPLSRPGHHSLHSLRQGHIFHGPIRPSDPSRDGDSMERAIQFRQGHANGRFNGVEPLGVRPPLRLGGQECVRGQYRHPQGRKIFHLEIAVTDLRKLHGGDQGVDDRLSLRLEKITKYLPHGGHPQGNIRHLVGKNRDHIVSLLLRFFHESRRIFEIIPYPFVPVKEQP